MMSTFYKKLFVPFITLIGFVLIISCGGSGNKKVVTNQNVVSAYDSSHGKSYTYTKYELPLSVDIYKFLKNKKFAFNQLLMHKLKDQDKYFTDTKRSFVLGVYSSDLVYAAIFDQSQDAVDYFGASIELANKLDIEDGYNSNTLDRAYKNIDNEDSLSYIVGESFWRTCSNLEKTKRDNILPMIVIGSWIESMHVLTRNCIGSSPESGIFAELYQQQAHLNNIIAYLNEVLKGIQSNNSKADIEAIIKRLNLIKLKYQEIDGSNLSELGLGQFKDVIFQIEDFRNSMLE
jgi:hypothetical protein